MGSQRVGPDWATERLHFSLSCIGEGNGNPLQCSCLENPWDGGAWWAAVYGVAQSRTRLKRRSSSSSSSSSSRLRMMRERETEERIFSSGIDWDLGKTGSAFASTVSRSRSISSFFLSPSFTSLHPREPSSPKRNWSSTTIHDSKSS